MNHLAGLRADTDSERGISPQTFNFYLKAVKQFCAWMMKNRRASDSPVSHLDGLNVATDRRHDRRALLPEELTAVLNKVQESEQTFRGLAGADRYALYLAACGSGFRAGELAVLLPEDFDFGSTPATVTLPARYTKNKKPVTQPLPSDVANVLNDYTRGKPTGQRVWAGTWWEKAAKMLASDLEAVGIPYITEGPDGPLFADFHSLRHAYITRLASGGVSPKMAQELARHSDIRLTMHRYTHVSLYDLGAAINSLPGLVPAPPNAPPERPAGSSQGDGHRLRTHKGGYSRKLGAPFAVSGATGGDFRGLWWTGDRKGN